MEIEETLTKTSIKILAVKIKMLTAVTTDRAAEDAMPADAAEWTFQHRKNH